ncbi:EF-P 5-aminopentanol modification-associated protein YfmF [Companilactobacillus zhachilii]|uniref:EF-P 5-aminopentanol modification-associated protein YfmF n=1 Tax=Companilactobacillus zhachilii TaxID=2304606 RepID=UPI001921840F|nr:insulinase family protein [Companilactobacillus zhachilii]MBL3531540.1 insulinase family protein [Companilactobacillus zhachilii]
MRKTLAKNIFLNINPIKKFRTIKIQVDFLRPLNREETTTRRLLANVMSNSTKDYPSFQAINDREMELYGSEINVYTRNLLNFNDLAFSVEFADPNFLIDGKTQLKDNLDLLGEIIFKPNLSDDKFDETAFETEKRNLMSNLLSIQDNQDLVSTLGLAKLIYRDDPNRQMPIFGSIDELKSLTNEDLLKSYREVIKNDAVVINVVGNVDETEFLNELNDSIFQQELQNDRADLKIELERFDDLIASPASQIDHKHLNQSRIALAYATEGVSKDFSRLAPQIMNLILGGDDQSQLFLQVREKNSLAYSVSSTYQPISHLVMIQAGLDADSVDKALDLINQQINFIKQGKFTDAQVEHAQKVMLTQRKISSDTIQHYIMRSIWETVYPKTLLTDGQFQAELDQLDKKHIASVADHMHAIAQYQLIGD